MSVAIPRCQETPAPIVSSKGSRVPVTTTPSHVTGTRVLWRMSKCQSCLLFASAQFKAFPAGGRERRTAVVYTDRPTPPDRQVRCGGNVSRGPDIRICCHAGLEKNTDSAVRLHIADPGTGRDGAISCAAGFLYRVEVGGLSDRRAKPFRWPIDRNRQQNANAARNYPSRVGGWAPQSPSAVSAQTIASSSWELLPSELRKDTA